MSTNFYLNAPGTAIDTTQKLKAFCSLDRLPIGSTITIGDETYTVKKCVFIEMKLFPKSNKISIIAGDVVIREDNKIKAFIHSLGLPNKNVFISAFWKRAKISGLIASTSGFYCDFTEFSIFDPK